MADKIPTTKTNPLKFGLITVDRRGGNVQKKFTYKDGKVERVPVSLSVTRGIFENQTATDGLAGMKAAIENLKFNQALTLGVAFRDGALKVRTGDIYKKYAENDSWRHNVIARTKECLDFSDTFALLLDHDPEPGHEPLTADQFWAKMLDLVPELAGVGRLVTTSTSSGIYHSETGECLKPESGHHTYLMASGPVEPFIELLKVRGWAKGQSFFKLANANAATGVRSILERHSLDMAVFSGERLVYEAGAKFDYGSPLEQRRTPPRLYEGATLDLGSLPEPTDDELVAAADNKAAARAAIEGPQLEHAVSAIAKSGHAKPRHEARRRIKLATNGQLESHHVVEFAGGGSILAGALSAEHDGSSLRDPQEPDYRGGAAVATFYWNDGKGWTIYSQAHGGCAYRAAAGTPVVRQATVGNVAGAASSDSSLKLYQGTQGGHHLCFVPSDAEALSRNIGESCLTYADDSDDMFSGQASELRSLIAAQKPSVFVLIPAGGDIENELTMAGYAYLSTELEILGHELQVFWTGQFAAGTGKLKEITREQFVENELISYAKFSKLKDDSAEGKARRHAISEANKARLFKLVRFTKRSGPRLTVPADLEFSEGYLSDAIEASGLTPLDTQTIILAAGCGSGKSTYIAELAKRDYLKGIRTDATTYRTSLAEKGGEEMDLGYNGRKNDHGVAITASKHGKGMSICVDSAHKDSMAAYVADDRAGNNLLLDEAKSTLIHMVFSSTLKHERYQVLREIKRAIYNATNPATPGRLIVSDAGIDDLTMTLIKAHSHPDALPAFVVKQTVKAKVGKVYRFRKADEVITTSLRHFTTNKKALWVCATGQKAESQYGSIVLERKYQASGLRVLRIDGQTIKLAGHPACEFLKLNRHDQSKLLAQYDCIISTSVLESGVSIEIERHFGAVYMIATGVHSPAAIAQFISRLRDFTLNRYMYVAETALESSFIANKQTTTKGLATGQQEKTKAIRTKIMGDCNSYDDDSEEGGVDRNVYNFWLKNAAKMNREFHNYAKSVYQYLLDDGWEIVNAAPVYVATLSVELKKLSNEEQQRWATTHARAESIDTDRADELNRLTVLNAQESAELARHGTEKRYCTQKMSPDLFLEDNAGLYSRLKMLYLLTSGKPFEVDHLKTEWRSLQGPNGRVFAPDLDKGNNSAKRTLLNKIRIQDVLALIDEHGAIASYSKSQPRIKALWARILRHKKEVEKVLKIKLGTAKAIGGINKIMFSVFGVRLKRMGTVSIKGKKNDEPTYRFPGMPYLDVLDLWLDKDVIEAKRKAEKSGACVDKEVMDAKHKSVLHFMEKKTLDSPPLNEHSDRKTPTAFPLRDLILKVNSVGGKEDEKVKTLDASLQEWNQAEDIEYTLKEKSDMTQENQNGSKIKVVVVGPDISNATAATTATTATDELEFDLPPMPQGDDCAMMKAMLEEVQAYEDYETIRTELEKTYGLNFERDVWPNVSQGAQSRIHSLYSRLQGHSEAVTA